MIFPRVPAPAGIYTGEAGYLALLGDVLSNGESRDDRTGVGTVSVYDRVLRWPVEWGFPRMTHRYLPFKPARVEVCWLLQGRNDLDYLRSYNVHTWDRWALPDGTLGPVYGVQLRRGVDQLRVVARLIREEPASRRLYWTMWNAEDQGRMALPPCHHSAQFYVSGLDTEPVLHMTVFMRSADVILGLPTDLMMYGIIHRLMARYAGIGVGDLSFHMGDTHVYRNLIDTASTLVDSYDSWYTWVMEYWGPLTLHVAPGASLEPWEVQPEDFSMSPYKYRLRYALADKVAV